jgi:hypothetical protein
MAIARAPNGVVLVWFRGLTIPLPLGGPITNTIPYHYHGNGVVLVISHMIRLTIVGDVIPRVLSFKNYL